MNLLTKTAFITAVAVVAVVPAFAFAQTSEPVTRAQIREELAQLEQAGYSPDCSMNCEASLRRAQAVIAQQRANGNAAYGPALNGTMQSGK
jgi:hypothetical protein